MMECVMSLRTSERSNRPANEIVVVVVRNEARCVECDAELWPGELLKMHDKGTLCLDCADLGHLQFLASGDAAVTRRATKYSNLRAVVVRWSSARKRYERQGILAEPEAIDRAERESQADAGVRAESQERAAIQRQTLEARFVQAFADAIRFQFPSCPPDTERKIAEHACLKYSGRVGRSAAAKQLDPQAVYLAVVAHIRHVHTDYDELLMRYDDRYLAREDVHQQVDRILNSWRERRL
jgi:hypothetical protein